MKTHRLKCWDCFFSEVAAKNKTAELRFDDRGFKVGDFLILEETTQGGTSKTGREFHAMITHVLTSEQYEGLKDGFCLISFSGGRLFQV